MGKKRRHHALTSLPGAILCLCAAVAGAQVRESLLRADPALARALELESKGETRAAAEAYRVWVDQHARLTSGEKDASSREAYAEVLLRFAELEPDARLLEHYLSTAPLALLAPAARVRITAALASLLDSLGDVSGAQSAYEQASRGEADQSGREARWRLWRSAALLYEQGIPDRAEAQAREALERSIAASDVALAADCRYLLGRVYAASDRPTEAEAIWRELADGQPDAASAPAACLALWVLCTAVGRPEDATGWLARMADRYPGSPELELARLAGGQPSRAVAAPAPADLVERFGLAAVSKPRAAPVLPAPVVAAAPAPARAVEPAQTHEMPQTVAVLAGSYTSRENAVSHLRTLEEKGFPSRLSETVVGGKRYFRVIVGEPGSYDAALELIARLKDKNLESVPLLIGPN